MQLEDALLWLFIGGIILILVGLRTYWMWEERKAAKAEKGHHWHYNDSGWLRRGKEYPCGSPEKLVKKRYEVCCITGELRWLPEFVRPFEEEYRRNPYQREEDWIPEMKEREHLK